MLLKGLERFTEDERKKIEKAYYKAKSLHDATGAKRKSGEPFFIHPLAVAQILVNLGEDCETVCAGLLHDTVEDTPYTLKQLSKDFGSKIAFLVDGVTKIKDLPELSKQDQELETIKKIIVSCASDIRILKVKLADRLHNMRTLNHMKPEKQKEIAAETLKIYVPLAKMIGAYRIKNELEDLCLKYLEPEKYQDTVKAREKIMETYNPEMEKMKEKLSQKLTEHHIEHRIEIRFKHAYDIYHYANVLKNPFLPGLKGLISLKIVTPDNLGWQKCFEVGACVMELWKTKSEIHNYITNPKPNGYESLHIEAFTDMDLPILMRIRTETMDKIATYGLTSEMYNSKIHDIFRVLVNFVINNQYDNSRVFVENLEQNLFAETILVYTKDGQLKNLPKGSTVIDFAYSIHSDMGDHLDFGFINGTAVQPETELKDGDVVEIVCSQNRMGPSPKWIEYAHSNEAQKRIKKFVRGAWK